MNNEIGVIFDMDGLLLDTEQVYLDSFVAAQVTLGFAPDPKPFLASIGISGGASAKIIADNLDHSVSLDQFNEIWDGNIDARLKHSVPTKKGVVELLNILLDRNIIMGVATSTRTPTARLHLELGGILDFFTCVIGRDQVTNPKPNPEPYLLAAKTLGRDITNCFAFEDSATGTRAALASGAKVCQVPDLQVPTDEVIAMGHLIAPNLMVGAKMVGLV